MKMLGAAIEADEVADGRSESRLMTVRKSDAPASLAMHVAEKQPLDFDLAGGREFFERCPLPSWVLEVSTQRFLAVNDAAVRQYGYSREEFCRMTARDIRSLEHSERLAGALQDLTSEMSHLGTWVHRRKDRVALDVEITAGLLPASGGRCALVYARNVTASRQLEDQYRQAQKMECIALLAGGIAHDFNNLLSVILGYSTAALGRLEADGPLREDMVEIHDAARRAAELTSQLLSFSRRRATAAAKVDLGAALSKLDKLLRRLLGAEIEVRIATAAELWPITIDPVQLEQVVMNLAVNARDAMPRGGRISLAASNVLLDEAHVAAHPGSRVGPHVVLSVSDNGTGMDPATLGRLFEPFFTTKEPGKGTGLGLSTVAAIVREARGWIDVSSQPGKGSTFHIYFPR